MTRSLLSIKVLFCLILSLVSQIISAEETQTTSTTLTVFHQKDGSYIKRGEIVGLPGVPKYIPYEHEIVSFKNSKDKFYQIKVRDESSGKVILQSVKMCQMVASDWNDEFVLHLDENNQFYYLNYYAGSDDCEDSVEYPITTKPFTTNVKVAQPASAPKPLIGNYATHKTQQASSKKPSVKVNDEIPDAKEIEEKSFFQKYWYLILGGAILLLTASGPPPPEAPPARR